MKKTIFITLVILLISSQTVFAITGKQIMKKVDKLKQPRSAKTKVKMTIYKGGRVLHKEFKALTKKVRGNDRTLISFIRPTRIKLLTHTYKNRDDDQWLSLSSGRVKRIASSDKGKPFVNSHFFYQDLQSRQLNDYNYKLLGESTVMGSSCYKVSAIKKRGAKVYSKVIFYVRKTDWFVLKIDIFKKGRLLKVLKNFNIKKIKGILTPYKIIMYQANGKGKTILKTIRVKYNIRVSSSLLSKEALR